MDWFFYVAAIVAIAATVMVITRLNAVHALLYLFLFVIMMLNLGPRSTEQESSWLRPRMWLGPITLTIILLIELIYMLSQSGYQPLATGTIEAKQVGIGLFGPYLLGAELASMLLLAGVVGAYH